MIHITIPGQPHPQQRARSTPGRKSPVKASSQRAAEYHFGLFVSPLDLDPLEGAVLFIAEYIFERPKSHWKKRGGLRKGFSEEHIQVPDRSNLDKHVEDCLNTIAYKDDCQITTGASRKRWAEEGEDPRTEIYLFENRPEFWQQLLTSMEELGER